MLLSQLQGFIIPNCQTFLRHVHNIVWDMILRHGNFSRTSIGLKNESMKFGLHIPSVILVWHGCSVVFAQLAQNGHLDFNLGWQAYGPLLNKPCNI